MHTSNKLLALRTSDPLLVSKKHNRKQPHQHRRPDLWAGNL